MFLFLILLSKNSDDEIGENRKIMLFRLCVQFIYPCQILEIM